MIIKKSQGLSVRFGCQISRSDSHIVLRSDEF